MSEQTVEIGTMNELRDLRAMNRQRQGTLDDAAESLINSGRVVFYEDPASSTDGSANKKGPSMSVLKETLRQNYFNKSKGEARAIQAFRNVDLLNQKANKIRRSQDYRSRRDKQSRIVIEQRPPFEKIFLMDRGEEKYCVFDEKQRDYAVSCGFVLETNRKYFTPGTILPCKPIERRQRPSLVQTVDSGAGSAAFAVSTEGPSFQLQVCRTIPSFKTAAQLCALVEKPFIEDNETGRVCSPLALLPLNAGERKRKWQELTPPLAPEVIAKNDVNYIQRVKQYWAIHVCDDYDHNDSTTVLNNDTLVRNATQESKNKNRASEGSWPVSARKIYDEKMHRITTATDMNTEDDDQPTSQVDETAMDIEHSV
mmetsp:Transcript_16278/g.21280  ORF Transcript_16278/g.21280 Transcript_16278/m.21280 type:complete len:368 (+) Transcript_16278:74-1177(+)|eukprot:CAMPEP_0197294360 /NCGR_PEP_ID=MMETSP0890-20130614/32188_1 /TAXON_ID=44058 ORGANISM="Aureoumbra lagunensis, Strain CCMP1510" /NCGR_SAMPLE_ID=MMETSP0890 /ASSEMBLY_ACC=CAM_ASM_000533 /LENGTH=367 /DNA_ID=CAMNT_0042769733 /DNA_START=68 /DNA_END=1171 /DNA_ORIENTATION=-